ncbi:MAG TPA: ATPase, T2SS/T4P/T4SS family [Phycisphaerae bacterium]|jgi:general secretion pathway protein E
MANPAFSGTASDVPAYVDKLLHRALDAGASDLHVEPITGAIEIRFRIDGVLESIEKLPTDVGRSVALRFMVMAQLLTYRLDIPQEGRIRTTIDGKSLDLRLAVIPVAHGLRAVLRMPAELTQPRNLQNLALPAGCLANLEAFARADSGMLLVTGPAGSGKTTTIYALLEHIARSALGISVISLEDPIERLMDGITQIEVAPHGQMTYDRALKSILRQDPQVLMLGEIRDAATASIAVQAALSGHRLIATLHAGDPAGALARLLEMGLEPYQITSSIFGILSQRLVRRKAPTGYKGRVPLAEFGKMDDSVRAAVLARADAGVFRKSFSLQAGHATLSDMAGELVAQGITDSAEIRRILGD